VVAGHIVRDHFGPQQRPGHGVVGRHLDQPAGGGAIVKERAISQIGDDRLTTQNGHQDQGSAGLVPAVRFDHPPDVVVGLLDRVPHHLGQSVGDDRFGRGQPIEERLDA